MTMPIEQPDTPDDEDVCPDCGRGSHAGKVCNNCKRDHQYED